MVFAGNNTEITQQTQHGKKLSEINVVYLVNSMSKLVI